MGRAREIHADFGERGARTRAVRVVVWTAFVLQGAVSSCGRPPSRAEVVTSSPSAAVTPAPDAGGSPRIQLIEVRGSPVKLIGMSAAGSDSDVVLTVENRSTLPIIYIGCLMMFPDCAELEHAPARWIRYGSDPGASTRSRGAAREPELLPMARAAMVVTHADLQMFEHTIEAKCPGQGVPELLLGKVVFGDGTAWEASGTSSGYLGKRSSCRPP
jgi:hypothetical protein